MGPRVLLIEDFEDAREMYRDYLRFMGYDVLAFESATEGLHAARQQPPDLILMDAALPGMTGWEAVRVLKSNPATRRIPVLMLTGHVLKDSRDEAVAAGADGFIAKPCLPDQLLREIRAALPAQRTRKRTKPSVNARMARGSTSR